MMPRIYFFFVLGVLPLAAQTGVPTGDKLNPDQVPQVVPTAPAGPAMLQPGVTAPPAGAPPVMPEMPAEPPVIPRMVEFIVNPSTVRESMFSKYTLATIIRLNVPAKTDMLFHVESSDLIKVVATDIKFIKGHDKSAGGIQINWTAIKHDCQVEFKAYDAANPDLVFHGRLYIRKAMMGPPPAP